MAGVVRTQVGYAGGTTRDPDYHHIGDHAEAIQVVYDPEVLSYEDLLQVFWSEHSPGTVPMSGQYRSAILCHDERQLALARGSKDGIERGLGKPLATQLELLDRFYPAEDYHQKYRLRGDGRLGREFAEMYEDSAELIASTAAARVNGFLGGHGSVQELRRIEADLGLTDAGLTRLSAIVERRDRGGLRSLFRAG